MKKNPSIQIVIVLFIGFCGCKKNSVNLKISLLTNLQWVRNFEEIKVESGPWTADTVFLNSPLCVKDNVFIFNTDNRFELNEGNTACASGNPPIYGTGNWSFENDYTQLILDGKAFNLDALDESTLKISVTYIRNGTSVAYRTTYKHF